MVLATLTLKNPGPGPISSTTESSFSPSLLINVLGERKIILKGINNVKANSYGKTPLLANLFTTL
jgi:hypothetical protein